MDKLTDELRNAIAKEILDRGGRVAYISSAAQNGNKPYYLSTIEDYKNIDHSIEVDYFDLSESFSNDDLSKLETYRIIYLSGGNTYAFLDAARKRGLEKILRNVIENDGLLIGVSAGAIMMTPTIDIAGTCGGDINNVGLIDTHGFNFVPFEFHPHYTENDKATLATYITKHTIYLCKDGDGILVTDNGIQKFGEIELMHLN
jgi:dipeptidase E